MIAFVADMLISEDMSIDFNFIAEVVLLVVDLWIMRRMLRGEVRR